MLTTHPHRRTHAYTAIIYTHKYKKDNFILIQFFFHFLLHQISTQIKLKNYFFFIKKIEKITFLTKLLKDTFLCFLFTFNLFYFIFNCAIVIFIVAFHWQPGCAAVFLAVSSTVDRKNRIRVSWGKTNAFITIAQFSKWKTRWNCLEEMHQAMLAGFIFIIFISIFQVAISAASAATTEIIRPANCSTITLIFYCYSVMKKQ